MSFLFVDFIIFPLANLLIVIAVVAIFRRTVKASLAQANMAVACFEHTPNGFGYLQIVQHDVYSLDDYGTPKERVKKKSKQDCSDFCLFLSAFVVFNI